MKNNFLVNSFLIFLAVVLVGSSAWMLPGLYQQRVDQEIDRFNSFAGEEQDLQSDIKIPTAALFAFRSLAIDYLWIRAENLKQEGQYFDALYLARAICALQPNLASIWDFQGWNMAYNISVGLPTGTERWQWVKSGFELLRDFGLKYNPHSLKIHWSIGWIFQHKIGAIADDYHRYYKTMFAYEMAPLLTPCYGAIDGRCTFEDIQAMSELPADYQELAKDPAVASLMQSLQDCDPQFVKPEDVLEAMVKYRVSDRGIYSEDFVAMVRANADNAAMWKLDRFSRAQKLRNVWKLDLARMNDLNTRYGPTDYTGSGNKKSLDWRTPWTYAIYWADHGLQYAAQDRSKNEMNIARLQRMIYHCLQDLYHYGNLKIYQFRPESAFAGGESDREVFDQQQLSLQIFNSQDLEMFEVAYKATINMEKNYAELKEEPPAGIEAARENLISNGIQSLYLSGMKEYAIKYYAQLKEDFPDKPEYQQPIEEYIRACMKEQIESITPKYASNYIYNLMRESYYQLAINEDENAYVREQWAKQIHETYYLDFQNEADPTMRTELPTLPEMKYEALLQFVADDSINPNIKGMLLGRIELEQPALYDRIMKELKRWQEEYEKASRRDDQPQDSQVDGSGETPEQ